MKKLTIEILSAYLPYGLKMYYEFLFQEQPREWKLRDGTLNSAIENGNKPILRPLSDLTKEIEHNGGKFVPIEKVGIYSPTKYGTAYLVEQIKTGFVEWIVLRQLIEWHFDVFGLIDKDLAIKKTLYHDTKKKSKRII